MAGFTILAVGAVISAAGSYMSYQGQKKAAEMEAKGLQAQDDANKYGNAVKRRAMIQNTRMTIGSVATTYASSGVGSSRTSSQRSIMSSQRTGLARSIKDSGVLQKYGSDAVNYSIEAQRGNTFSALGGVVTTVGSAIMSFGSMPNGGTTTTLQEIDMNSLPKRRGIVNQGSNPMASYMGNKY
jgi:hypothetical protein